MKLKDFLVGEIFIVIGLLRVLPFQSENVKFDKDSEYKYIMILPSIKASWLQIWPHGQLQNCRGEIWITYFIFVYEASKKLCLWLKIDWDV